MMKHLAFLGFVLAASFAGSATSGATSSAASNSVELLVALKAAKGGEVIELADGDYGDVVFDGFDFDEAVTVKSAAPGGADFSSIKVTGSQGLIIDGVHVDNPTNGGRASKVVSIDASSRISLINSEVNGSVSVTDDFEEFQGHYGVFLGDDATDIRVEGNRIHDVKHGVVALGPDRIEIINNRFNRIGSDSMKIAGSNGVLIEDNLGPRKIFRSPDAHVDFIQFQGASKNITIRGNVYIAGNIRTSQGIFMSDGAYDDVLIEQNIIYTGSIHGISLYEGSGITIRRNTILNMPGGPHRATIIKNPEGAKVEDNIASSVKGVYDGSNLWLEHRNRARIYHYSRYFANAEGGLGLTPRDFAPVAGSLAEVKGAADRIETILRSKALMSHFQ